ncbi:MAG: EamA family transporter RarD [Sumerlaeia bacterium]
MDDDKKQRTLGVLLGAGSYLWWGFMPAYFKLLDHIPAWELTMHRAAWTCVLLVAVAVLRGALRPLREVIRQPKLLGVLAVTTLLICTNWGVFLYAINTGRIVQGSLGYFINPLVNVALGVLFLRERLRPLQGFAIALAATGVGLLTWHYGVFPWISVILACSFGFYGLLRKMAPVGAMEGLTIETGLILPITLGAIVWLAVIGEGAFLGGSMQDNVLLAVSGIITATPLLLFAAAVKRLQYATVGILQYLSPTIQFLLAVLAYGEPMDRGKLFSFCFIWAALAVYSWDGLRSSRAKA